MIKKMQKLFAAKLRPSIHAPYFSSFLFVAFFLTKNYKHLIGFVMKQ